MLQDLQRMHRYISDRRQELLKQITSLKGNLKRAKELYIRGDLSMSEYEEKRDGIQEQTEVSRQELGKLDNLDSEVRRIEFRRLLLLSIGPSPAGIPEIDEEGFVDNYSIFTDWGGEPTRAVPNGGKERASERRQDFYRKMSLCVRVQPDDLEVEIANLAISQSVSPS
ncbi:MAG: hypothetical protein H0U55_04000 [Rubrobacteraceae bacterium]|nr:hypothetical protein [Rubrobacteraceae bacterium]